MILFSTNSEDPDETPHYVASHLGLRCFTMSHLWDARLKRVNLGPWLARKTDKQVSLLAYFKIFENEVNN